MNITTVPLMRHALRPPSYIPTCLLNYLPGQCLQKVSLDEGVDPEAGGAPLACPPLLRRPVPACGHTLGLLPGDIGADGR